MMVAIFAAMLAALALGWLGQQRLSCLALAIAFGLAAWLFQFEIYSPEYGFRMPWIQTEFDGDPNVAIREA